jgi:hypothetical protein
LVEYQFFEYNPVQAQTIFEVSEHIQTWPDQF